MPWIVGNVRSGDQDIDALLGDYRWATTSLSFSFPSGSQDYGSDYPDAQETQYSSELSDDQQAAVIDILDNFSSVANLSFAQRSGGAGDLRLSESFTSDSAYAYSPHFDPRGGDSWFSRDDSYGYPVKGDYAYFAFMHEIGHSLGLKHGHEMGGFGALTAEHDTMEFSVMTYRSYEGGLTDYGFINEEHGFAQSLMMYDIAALQHMYGANYGSNAGDTVYRWDENSGEMFANGVGEGAPGENRVFLTVWDGNGSDTYDLSNYKGAVFIDLGPSEWTFTSGAQLADLGMDHEARGNIANALLHDGDPRSLIENAVGGAGNDRITGNDAANVLKGRGGINTLSGLAGDDTLVTGAGGALHEFQAHDDRDRSSRELALSVDGAMSLDHNWGAEAPTVIPHTTINAWTTEGPEWYRVTVEHPGQILLDIDDTAAALTLELYDAAGKLLARNESAAASDAGSEDADHPYLAYDVEFSGQYYVRVVKRASEDEPVNRHYILHISVPGAATGLEFGSLLDGGDGDDTLTGGGAADTLLGGIGQDALSGDGGADTLRAGEGADVLIGGDSADGLFGGAGDDRLEGGAGLDLLDGGSGMDTLDGGAGADADTLLGGGGTDLVTYAAAASGVAVNLSLSGWQDTGGAGIDMLADIERVTGSGFADALTGDGKSNVLDGGLGSDVLSGGAGSDTYVVDAPRDRIVEGETGIQDNDLVLSSVSYNLSANVERLTLTGDGAINGRGNELGNMLVGNDAANLLEGFAGADEIDGGGGADTMRGGDGGDVYEVDHLLDRVVETAANDTDHVTSSVSFALGAHVEHLYLTGQADLDGTGNALANHLAGNEGDNLLDGGAGADRMSGGAGNDIYVIDSARDIVVERAGGGTDAVTSLVSFTLGATIENLQLLGTAAVAAIGNAAANNLAGNAAANILDGRAGADLMKGGAGDDIYRVDRTDDRVVELGAGDGLDRIEASVSFALGRHVENLLLVGAGDIGGTGNSLANRIAGNGAGNRLDGGAGHDFLLGGSGNDFLYGGTGTDRLEGGEGLDAFHFDTVPHRVANADTILDFSAADDVIRLDRDVFTGIAVNGRLAPGAFREGGAAADSSDRILYDARTGDIFYDPDGTGEIAAVLFARVDPGTALTNADFSAYI